MTGHTADDQAETTLIRLLRGSGSDGLGAITPSHRHPLLALRRSETEAVCAAVAIDPVWDPSNASDQMWRNRIRAELLPLANNISGRDIVPILNRSADLLRDESTLLDELAAHIDPTDVKTLVATNPVLARRAIRRWLTVDGYPPDAAGVERVMAVARGESVACELPGGTRVARSRQRLSIVRPER